jgi:hypothetical protein
MMQQLDKARKLVPMRIGQTPVAVEGARMIIGQMLNKVAG